MMVRPVRKESLEQFECVPRGKRRIGNNLQLRKISLNLLHLSPRREHSFDTVRQKVFIDHNGNNNDLPGTLRDGGEGGSAAAFKEIAKSTPMTELTNQSTQKKLNVGGFLKNFQLRA